MSDIWCPTPQPHPHLGNLHLCPQPGPQSEPGAREPFPAVPTPEGQLFPGSQRVKNTGFRTRQTRE